MKNANLARQRERERPQNADLDGATEQFVKGWSKAERHDLGTETKVGTETEVSRGD